MANRSRANLGFVQVDLWFVAALGLWTVASASGIVDWSIGRMALGLVAVLFAPGYALVSALFPTEETTTDRLYGRESDAARDERTVSEVERLLLAVGLSVCVVPLLGIGLSYTSGGVQPSPFLSVIGATTVLLTVIAAVRRLRLPAQERFSPQPLRRVLGVSGQVRNLPTHSAVTALLLVGLVVAASGIGFAVLRADQGEQFTEFYIVTEDQTGETVAGGYPDELAPGETGRVQVGITNQEGETTTYTVVALIQSTGDSGEIESTRRLDTFAVTVPPGETATRTHTIRPEMTGKDLRVTYLLYVGSPPDGTSLGTDSAYRQVHFWIDVVPPESG